MGFYYSTAEREVSKTALPDIEVFHIGPVAMGGCTPECPIADGFHAEHVGWYWQACFPGCLPDGEPCGPFATEADALADARLADWD